MSTEHDYWVLHFEHGYSEAVWSNLDNPLVPLTSSPLHLSLPTVNSVNLIPRLSFSLSISACALLATQSALILIEVNTPAIAILLATVGVVVSIPGVWCSSPKDQIRFRVRSDLVTVCSNIRPPTTSYLPISRIKDILLHSCWHLNSNKAGFLHYWESDELTNPTPVHCVHLIWLSGHRFVPLVASAIHDPRSPVAFNTEAYGMVSLWHSFDQLSDHRTSLCVQSFVVSCGGKCV
jgi:hypothetical protein